MQFELLSRVLKIMFIYIKLSIIQIDDRPNWLLYGDLLCISMDGSFQEPVWAVVDKHIGKQRLVINGCSFKFLSNI